MVKLSPQHEWSNEIYKTLINHFSEAELRDLCFKLGVDYEDLPGQVKTVKAQELIKYAIRHSYPERLVEEIREARSGIEIEDFPIKTHVPPIEEPGGSIAPSNPTVPLPTKRILLRYLIWISCIVGIAALAVAFVIVIFFPPQQCSSESPPKLISTSAGQLDIIAAYSPSDATKDYYESPLLARKAVDNDLATCWTSLSKEKDPRLLLVLQVPQVVNRIRFYAPNPHDYLTVQTATLNFPGTNADSQKISLSDTKEWNDINITPVTTEHIEIEIGETYRGTTHSEEASIYEVQVYGQKQTSSPIPSNAKILTITDAIASSVSTDNSTSQSDFSEKKAIDEKIETNWSSGNGVITGTSLNLSLNTTYTVTHIAIYSPLPTERYFGLPIKKATLMFSNGLTQTITLKGAFGWEYVPITPPIKTDTVEIIIDTIYQISNAPYVSIYEIELLGLPP